MSDNTPIMTPTPTTPRAGPNKIGDINVAAKTKASTEVRKKEKRKKKTERTKKKNSDNNNNQVKHSGLVKDEILNGITFSLGMSGQMTTDYRHFIMSTVAYDASKVYKD